LQSCGKSYDKIDVVGLAFCFMSGAVSYHAPTLIASVDDDISALGIRLGAYGAKYSAAGVCPVAGVYVNVQRAKAEWAVITRRIAERKHLAATGGADKALVVFSESLFFHGN